jgi:hypothetical protein
MSSPLLIRRLNVPDDVFGETTSHLKLSLVPSANWPADPSVEVLFWTAPSAIVSNVNEADVSELTIIELVADV